MWRILTLSLLIFPDAVSADPLVQQSDLTYLGSFRVPAGNLGGDSIKTNTLAGGGESALAYNPNNNSLYIVGAINDGSPANQGFPVEISIPTLVTGDISSLNTATVLQAPRDLTDGNREMLGENNEDVVVNGARIGGMLKYGTKIIGSVYSYYDGGYDAARSHFTANASDWSTSVSFQGMYKLGTSPSGYTVNGGIAGGSMDHIPTAWQVSLGGDAVTGRGGEPVIARSSRGPTMSVFSKADTTSDDIPATMLIGYPGTNSTLGTMNVTYNSTSEFHGTAIIDGTDSVLFFGRHGVGFSGVDDVADGLGETNYGFGTTVRSEHITATDLQQWFTDNPAETHYTCGSNQISEANALAGDGCAYDLARSDKGTHAFPYVNRIWAYDLNYVAKVKAGSTIQTAELPDLVTSAVAGQTYQPWHLKPYGVWNFSFPYSSANENNNIIGAAYDHTGNKLYMVQFVADQQGAEYLPIIHAYSVDTVSQEARHPWSFNGAQFTTN